MERNYDADYVNACTRLVMEGTAPVGMLIKDMAEHSVCPHVSPEGWPLGQPRLK